MEVSVWYPRDQHPPKVGCYLAYKEMSMGDDETGVSWYYWNGESWRTSEYSNGYYANITWWSDVSYEMFQNLPVPLSLIVNPTERAAYIEVKEAIDRYRVVKELCR